MTQARLLTVIATAVLVAVQLVIFTGLRVEGVVIMLFWLWPVALGLAGSQSLAVLAGISAGLLFDAHVPTPFGASAAVGALLGYVAARLGREGVGDLDSAALWVAPVIGGVAGAAAPMLFVLLGALSGHLSLYKDSLVNSMAVNGVVFFVAVRPMTRLAHLVTARIERAR